MSQPITEVPMAVMSPPAAYPTNDAMSTNNTSQVAEEQTKCENHPNNEGSFLLRLRGGGGCITDCLAAIGCCCVCEACCC